MTRRIIVNAFDMSCVTHQAPGLWRHPDNHAHRYTDLSYWTELARLLERGTFDAIFIADVLGVYDVYRDSVAPALVDAAQVPLGDPVIPISAMAAATEHLGFGVTVASTYEQPYQLARRFSTLDHLTQGRIGWNVVTSYLDSAARNLGFDKQLGHDDRYEVAEDFLDASYKLWEGSWEDGAVIRDRERGVFTDPAKVHPIGHEGAFYRVPGIHLAEPSPQRTPVIFQAGASPRGREFAARHGEAIFINGLRPEITRKVTDDIRNRAEALGRPRDSVKILTLATVIVAPTDEEAEAKYAEYREHVSLEGALALYGGWSGLDLSEFDPDVPLKYVDTDAARSALSIFTTADPEREWTPRDIAHYVGIGGIGAVIVGSPTTVADELERWIDVGGIDGFNLAYVVTPGTFEDFVELAVPELRRRGRMAEEYPDGTLRGRLRGDGSPVIPEWHPAHAYRGAFADGPSALDGQRPSTIDEKENTAS
ncbi:FMN-dependent oxidoreductase (nitrilotriacetate monooxygenase family) [Microbacteriaceae bacterium SG_E_30_P1]|uniref:FMN-dependent oxidoreductase (Nitrilotriacetate monooxygenase family) n=1 Tax=Antiquaquibacter oligotrophicus TaxID=2880260 RepID=A0ABT6KR81_9MICO|nr:LLM class flavin-dependent oxidoreductase [Antiquaquibacter oligotrophicus]MDH6181712.1 FMN-dependent oxidoreductase (nitrilotriacetate monooxygenase family) [Antiquaquibacter oligotrophicus]UDF12605.1 LLM class flavin-dependent oxidoreductase [Antiquaquibacter oligotrophicus]